MALLHNFHSFSFKVKVTFFLSITFLAFYDLKEVGALLGIDAIEETEYSLTHDRDVSFIVNGNRFHKANTLLNIREEYFNDILIGIGVVWFSTFVLLYGVFKNSMWSILYWMVVVLAQMVLLTVWTIYELWHGKHMDYLKCNLIILFYLTEFVPTIILFMFCKQLRQINKMREVATIAIPCPAPYSQYSKVTLPREDRIVYNGSNGYTHILSNT